MSQAPSQTRSVKRVAVIAADAASLLRQREELLAAILARRHTVLALLPELEAARGGAALTARGVEVAGFPMASPEPQLLADGKTVTNLAATLADWRAHVVLAAGAKPLALGAMAAKKAGITRRVGLVTTLPAPMRQRAETVPGWAWRRLMKAGFKALDAAIFHADADRERLRKLGWLPGGLVTQVVPGAGVDLVRNSVLPLPPLVVDGRPALNILMVARKDAAKGVREFCEAARLVRARAPETRFLLAGADGDVPSADLGAFEADVQVIGDQPDVRYLLGACHLVVLPAWADASPRILLEALAAGRPIVTSAVPGCREVVDERVNGVLVPPRNPQALAEAILSVLKRPDLIPAMARASRAKAERRYAVGPVNTALLDLMGL